MPSSNRRASLAAVGAVAAVALGACGNDNATVDGDSPAAKRPSEAALKNLPPALAKNVRDADTINVHLKHGGQLRAEQLLVAIGREPRIPPGLENADVEIGPKGITIDEHCRAGVIVNLIGATTTRTGLEVYARLDEREYPKGVAVSDAELAAVNLEGAHFHPEWNYTIKPRVDC